MKQLRAYQQQGIDDIRAAMATHKRIIYALPTGAGKTAVATQIVKQACDKGKRVLWLAPRRELVYQARDDLSKTGYSISTIMASAVDRQDERPITVASLDTLHSHRKNPTFIDPYAELVIFDEAHLAAAPTRQAILTDYADKYVIGLTATPARTDGKALGDIFDRIVQGPTVRELMDMGYLVEARYFAPTKYDLSKVRMTKGDYNQTELGHAVDQPKLVGDIVDHWFRLAEYRSTVVFAVNVKHSMHIRDEFLQRGVNAEHLDANTPLDERAAIMQRVTDGITDVLVNCLVMTYGIDIPRLSCAVLARPTKSIVNYRQSVGRILRPFEGKDHALIIDHSGIVNDLGYVCSEIQWTLQGSEAIASQDRTRERVEREERECKACGHMFTGAAACPECGELPPAPTSEEIAALDAELIEQAPGIIKWDAPRKEKVLQWWHNNQELYQQLIWIRDEKDRKPLWPWFVYWEILARVHAWTDRQVQMLKDKDSAMPFERDDDRWAPLAWRKLKGIEPHPKTRAAVEAKDRAYASKQRRRNYARQSAFKV